MRVRTCVRVGMSVLLGPVCVVQAQTYTVTSPVRDYP